jgi:hypothetical protein
VKLQHLSKISSVSIDFLDIMTGAKPLHAFFHNSHLNGGAPPKSRPGGIPTIISGNKLALSITCLCLFAPPLLYIYRYRSSIKKHIKEIEANVSISKVVRNKNIDARTISNRITCMELNPAFVLSKVLFVHHVHLYVEHKF